MKKGILIVGTIGAIGAAAILVAGRWRSPAPASMESEKLPVEEVSDSGLIAVDHADRYPLARIEMRRFRQELKVNASVSADVSRSVPVNAMTSGRVFELKVRLGDDVQKGQLLLTMHSPDLAQAIADYQKAQADELLARRQLERSQLLYSHGAVAQKDVQVAQDAEDKAKVDVETAAQRIRILGGSLDQFTPVIELRAPVSGTIVEQNVTGSAGVKSLDNSPNLFTIADLSEVWVLCDVYEDDLAKVHLGDGADVRVNAYPDRVFRAHVSNISRVLDPSTRSAKVRLELENRGGLLRPGMFATATFYSQSATARPVAPTSAILRLHDRDWVFVPAGENRFRRVAIQAGAASPDGWQEVLAGLKAGDLVVENALQLSSVSNEP